MFSIRAYSALGRPSPRHPSQPHKACDGGHTVHPRRFFFQPSHAMHPRVTLVTVPRPVPHRCAMHPRVTLAAVGRSTGISCSICARDILRPWEARAMLLGMPAHETFVIT